MSDRAATTLSLTPVARPWLDSVERVVAYLAIAHDADEAVPTEASLDLVDPIRGLILNRNPITLTDSFGGETPGITMWRTVGIDVILRRTAYRLNFSFREVGDTASELAVWFPDEVWRRVFLNDPEERAFDPDFKAELVQLFVGVGAAVKADGFAYRVALADSLFGAVSVDYVREYVQLGVPRDTSPPLLAGLSRKVVEPGRFAADEDVPSYHYKYGGYCLFDLVWPDIMPGG